MEKYMETTNKNHLQPHQHTPKRPLKPVKCCGECMCGQSALNLIDIRSIYDHFSIDRLLENTGTKL